MIYFCRINVFSSLLFSSILIVDTSIYVFHIVYNLHVMLDDFFFIINQNIWTSDCYAYYTVEFGIKQLN